MATPFPWPYDARYPAGFPVRQEERINRLERDLAVLEGIVENVVKTMAAEHQAMRENRHEDRVALKELGDKMEKSVTELAKEIKSLAKKETANDGALSFGRWIVGTALTLGALIIAYQAGKNNEPHYIYGAPTVPAQPRAVK